MSSDNNSPVIVESQDAEMAIILVPAGSYAEAKTLAKQWAVEQGISVLEVEIDLLQEKEAENYCKDNASLLYYKTKICIDAPVVQTQILDMPLVQEIQL